MGSMRVKIWGTRGLISSPRHDTAIFGGNTPCIQVLHGDHLILVDTGFGCANLGDQLMKRILDNNEKLEIHIFFTHFHWDHIQGLPFFKPIYFETTRLHLYSPQPSALTLENLNILFDGSYSPFESLLTMQAGVFINQLNGPMEIDGLKIDYIQVDHGDDVENLQDQATYAYRFISPEDEKLVIATDHEARPGPRNDAVVAFAKDADLLIHDGQYRDDEYAKHIGWGHSSANQALENAMRSNCRRALLTHHAPYRSDRDLQVLHRDLMKRDRFKSLDFEFAREDTFYDVRAQVLRFKQTG